MSPSAPLPPVSLTLASASPARLATLRAAGVEPRVVVSGVDEEAALRDARARFGELVPEDCALLLARCKCEDVATRLEDEGWDGLVVGCDSVLELGGDMHGKPASPEEARARWRLMRGASGVLHTGHWLVDLRDEGEGACLGSVSSTTVYFANLSDDEIDAYVATGEPLRVAGAFTVDGLGGPFVERIEGDHHAVVGLGLPVLRELALAAGVQWRRLLTR